MERPHLARLDEPARPGRPARVRLEPRRRHAPGRRRTGAAARRPTARGLLTSRPEYAGAIGRLLLFLTIAAAALVPASPAPASTVGRGPPGVRFYTPPRSLPPGRHGALIRARRLTGPAVLAGASVNELLLYRSIGVDGRPTAVSGTVAI